MAHLFLDEKSRERLQAWLKDDLVIHGLRTARLFAIRHGLATSITLEELAAISDHKHPEPLSQVIVPDDFHVKEVVEST